MNEHILIAYYSRSGNTQKIADIIQQQTGGTLHQIEPVTPYPKSYNAVVDQAKVEIRAGFQPEINSTIETIDSYETIFIGSPNWWNTIAPPVATFLSNHDLSAKTIIPFCTHGGGGLGRISQDIARLCPQSILLDSLEIYGSRTGNAQAKVNSWLRELGLTN